MTWRWEGSERLELVGRQKYEGVEGAGGIVYEQSEVDHHRGSQAKAKQVMEGTIRGKLEGG